LFLNIPLAGAMRCCRGSSEDWPGSASGLSFWTLAFPAEEQERHFVESRKADVARYLIRCCFVTLLSSLLLLAWMWLTWLSPVAASLSTTGALILTPNMLAAIRIQMACTALVGVIGLFLLGVCVVRHVFERIKALQLEVFGTICIAMVLCLTVLSQRPYIIKMMGHDPSQEWGECYRHSDAVVILLTLGFTQAGNMIPIRWKVLSLINVVGLFLYIGLMSLGSVDPEPGFNLIILAAVLYLITLGKRTLEVKERKAHCDLVAEKCRRCEAEFELSHIQSSEPHICSEILGMQDQRSEFTMCTEQIFETNLQIAETADADLATSIARIAQVGKQEHWLIKSEELRLIPNGKLGHGGFGTVLKGVFHGSAVAVKVFSGILDSTNVDRQLASLCNELRITRQLRHPNIVGLHGAILDSRGWALVLELVDGITLQQYVLEDPTPSMCHRFSALLGVCCGLMYLHSRQPCIIHGDIKGGNVMVEDIGRRVRAKVLDFGLSRVLAGNPKILGGSLAWMAPEVYRVRDVAPSRSSDVFSFGRLMYLTLAARIPCAGMPKDQLCLMLQTAMLPTLLLPGKHAVERHCTDILDSCLRINVIHRPSMQEIHDALVGVAGHVHEVAQFIQDGSTAEQLSWSPNAVAQCVKAPSPNSRTHSHAARAATIGLSSGFLEGNIGHTSPKTRLILQDWLPTKEESMYASLLVCIQHWNFPLPESACCCPFHATMQVLSSLTATMTKLKCQPTFGPTGSSQCKDCGWLLDSHSESCHICELTGPDLVQL